ncbi:YncE family protein [Mycolicibacterium pulveris]|uniref:YncE family protein n=1 Tax=Mycolicibacterium pulveris TaxID=36813 RepID=UPI003CECB3F3
MTNVQLAGSVEARRGPIGDVAAADGVVVVANYGDDSISVLDAATLAVQSIIALPGEPVAVAVADDRAYVGTSSGTHDEVSVVDLTAKSVIATYGLALSVTALTVSPDGKRVFAARTGDGYADVAVIDVPAERMGTIEIAAGAGIGIDAVEVDASGKRLYVGTTDARGSALVVVNVETARVERAVQIGAPIRDIAVADGTVYVLTSDRARGGVVHVIALATGRITGTVQLGGAPTQLVMGTDKTRAYVVDYDRVVVLGPLTRKVTHTITVDARPSSVAVDGDRLHIADYAGVVTSYDVEPARPLTYSDFVATDPIAVPEVAELEPAAV